MSHGSLDLDVVILTDRRYEDPPDPDWYAKQVLLEDGLVRDALERRGLRTARLDWAGRDFDWSRTRSVLFRTTWDYFHRIDDFRDWLDRVSAQTRLINPESLIRWNLDKRYLHDLADRGVRVVPSRFIEPGSDETLPAALERAGWTEAVLKPVVSGSARETYRITPENAAEHEATFRRLVAAETMMLQPFQRAVLDGGELSLMVIGGRLTHAVRKVARRGDFRVQDDHGGTVRKHAPRADEIEFAESVAAACTPRPLYARVDAVRDDGGGLAVMELELIEPELFFRLHGPAADALAGEVATALA